MDAVADAPVTPTRSRAKGTKRITAKQQHYANLRAQGLTRAQAAQGAGYHNKQSAYKADRNPVVQQHLSTIHNLAQVATAHTVVQAMAEADRAMEFAYKTTNANAVVKAVELRAKLSGLLIDRVEVFSADLKGALLAASQRVIEAAPGTYALMQETQAQLQADESNRVNP